MSEQVRAVWTCQCGRTRWSDLSSARCPYCKSAVEIVDGRIYVTSGSWRVANEYRKVSPWVTR